MHKLTDSDIRYLLNQDRLTKLEGVALLTGGYQEHPSNLDRLAGRSSKILAFQNVLEHREPRPKRPENILIYEKILEIDETIIRSLGFTLNPVEDILDLSVLGSVDPTFETWHFLEWANLKGFVPPELSQDLQPFFANQSNGPGQIQATTVSNELQSSLAQEEIGQKPDLQPKSKDIDYTIKTESEKKELVRRWFEANMTRWGIAQKLYPNDIESGVSKATLLKRVDRLRGISN